MKLEIGAGDRPTKGYMHMDIMPGPGIDYMHDATVTPYEFEDKKWDEIYSHWFLEHIAVRDIDRILMEWRRILKDDGVVRVVTNNQEAHNVCLFNGEISWEEWTRLTYGVKEPNEPGGTEPVNVFECHKIGWSPYYANKVFSRCGFLITELTAMNKCREDDGRIKCPGLIIVAEKNHERK